MNRCSLIRGVHYETYQSTIYQLPEFNIQIAVYQFVYAGTVYYKKDADADDIDAIKLMYQHPLASGCDEEFAQWRINNGAIGARAPGPRAPRGPRIVNKQKIYDIIINQRGCKRSSG